MTIVDHGVPIRSTRQWSTLLSPNATNTGWNFIAEYGTTTIWNVVLKNFTTTPIETQYSTLTHEYGSILYQISNSKQLRAPNGRIFIPQFANYTTYYDPVTEDIHQIGPVVETPPIDVHASTTFYGASFDVAGLLYFSTQESHFRQSMIVVTDTTTTPPTQTILGYVGSGALSYTTYGYRLAPDTVTSEKWIYVAYGENPWQLWALHITTGIATKLYEVTSTGNIFFTDKGQGWIAEIDSALNQPGNVHTKLWCLDGATYPYVTPFTFTCDYTIPHLHAVAHGQSTGDGPYHVSTNSSLPTGLTVGTDYWWIKLDNDNFQFAATFADAMSGTPVPVTTNNGVGVHTITQQAPGGLARTVTPASNPLVSPPHLDVSAGAGIVGWRAGNSGPYTYLNYTVNDAGPVTLEGLVASNDGLVCNGQTYLGFVKFIEPADTHTYSGPWLNGLSQGPRLNLNGTIYAAGYPNGVLYSYNPDAAWDPTNVTTPNPKSLGNYGLNGNQFAGIKYADFMDDGPLAGAAGRIFCCGARERNGSGSGIGSWDKTSKAFAGTYSETGMDVCLPDGMAVLGGISRVVMSTRLIPPGTLGTAHLFVFDYALGLVASLPVITNLASLGQIYETSTPNVITGIVQGASSQLRLWQYNVQTQMLVADVTLPIVGTLALNQDGSLGVQCQRFGGSVWLMSGNNLVRVDVSALTATVIQDMTSIAPVIAMSFAADQSTLFFAAKGSSGVSGAQLFSLQTGNVLAINGMTGVGVMNRITMINNGATRMTIDGANGIGIGGQVTFVYTVLVPPPDAGANAAQLVNGESTPIYRGQPVYANGEGTVRLAVADGSGSAVVAGLVGDAVIQAGQPGTIVAACDLHATPAEWDAVCGTIGGLIHNTMYYLHPAIPGRLTLTAPSSDGKEAVPVVKALSPVRAILSIRPPVLL